jgi:hypothetical protein
MRAPIEPGDVVNRNARLHRARIRVPHLERRQTRGRKSAPPHAARIPRSDRRQRQPSRAARARGRFDAPPLDRCIPRARQQPPAARLRRLASRNFAAGKKRGAHHISPVSDKFTDHRSRVGVERSNRAPDARRASRLARRPLPRPVVARPCRHLPRTGRRLAPRPPAPSPAPPSHCRRRCPALNRDPPLSARREAESALRRIIKHAGPKSGVRARQSARVNRNTQLSVMRYPESPRRHLRFHGLDQFSALLWILG